MRMKRDSKERGLAARINGLSQGFTSRMMPQPPKYAVPTQIRIGSEATMRNARNTSPVKVWLPRSSQGRFLIAQGVLLTWGS